MKCEVGQEVKTKQRFIVEFPTIGLMSIPEGTKARITGISRDAAGVIRRLWISFPKLDIVVMPEDVNYHSGY